MGNPANGCATQPLEAKPSEPDDVRPNGARYREVVTGDAQDIPPLGHRAGVEQAMYPTDKKRRLL